jgi:hypothetical protein
VQADILYQLSTSLGAWHKSRHGSCIRFCDHGTLLKVREVWKFYSAGAQESMVEARLRSGVERARRQRRSSLDQGITISVSDLLLRSSLLMPWANWTSCTSISGIMGTPTSEPRPSQRYRMLILCLLPRMEAVHSTSASRSDALLVHGDVAQASTDVSGTI